MQNRDRITDPKTNDGVRRRRPRPYPVGSLIRGVRRGILRAPSVQSSICFGLGQITSALSAPYGSPRHHRIVLERGDLPVSGKFPVPSWNQPPSVSAGPAQLIFVSAGPVQLIFISAGPVQLIFVSAGPAQLIFAGPAQLVFVSAGSVQFLVNRAPLVSLGLLVDYEGMVWSPAPEPAPHQSPPVPAPRQRPPVPSSALQCLLLASALRCLLLTSALQCRLLASALKFLCWFCPGHFRLRWFRPALQRTHESQSRPSAPKSWSRPAHLCLRWSRPAHLRPRWHCPVQCFQSAPETQHYPSAHESQRFQSAPKSWSRPAHLCLRWSRPAHLGLCWSRPAHLGLRWSRPAHLGPRWSRPAHLGLRWSRPAHLRLRWSRPAHLCLRWPHPAHLGLRWPCPARLPRLQSAPLSPRIRHGRLSPLIRIGRLGPGMGTALEATCPVSRSLEASRAPPPLPFRCYTARDVPIGKGGVGGGVMSDFVSLCLVFPYPCVTHPYLVLPVSCHH